MLRSRGDRAGRFQTSPRRAPCVYFARAGATIRTSSFIVCSCPCAAERAISASTAIIPVKSFIDISPYRGLARPSFGRLHAIEAVDEVMLFLGLMTGEATIEVLLAVHRFIGIERLELPLAIALLGWVLGSPALALFHKPVAKELSIAIIFHGDHSVGRKR